MAISGYLLAGFIFGFVLIILYVLCAIGTEGFVPELRKAGQLLLAANGITVSVRLFVLIVTAESLGAFAETDRLYVGIGALGALWLSIETIAKVFAPFATPLEGMNNEETEDD